MNLIDKRELLNERPEMLNPNMNDDIKSAYNKGWNACNSEWIGLLDDDPSEMVLIDKNKLLKELRKYHPISYGIFSDIEYFPTAYDIEKIVKILEEKANNCQNNIKYYGEKAEWMSKAYRDAIEVIKNNENEK